jgi:diguanylate cyclase (GGDEF)-like protein
MSTPATTPTLIDVANGRSILVLEDDPDFGALVRSVLVAARAKVTLVTTLAAARAAAFAGRPDLILSDKNLPDGSGLDLLALAKAERWDTDLVLMSAEPTLDTALTAIRLDAADYLVKPCTVADLKSRLTRVLALRRTRLERDRLLEILERENADLKRRSSTDTLTGLATRAALDRALASAVEQARALGGHASLIFVDVDGFKRLNDTAGHAAGDRALTVVADVVAGRGGRAPIFTGGDLVARLGGDELVVLMPGTRPAAAAAAAIRMQAQVHAAFRESAELAGLSISVGVATFPDHAGDGPGLLAAADDAMYRAKHAGKGRLSTAVAPGSEAA